jgi:hypothetical protein
MNLFNSIFSLINTSNKKLVDELHINRLLLGKQLSNSIREKGIVNNLSDVEFKVFSQWGDDGIIQYLIQHTEIPFKTFIEFGVENYTEANTRFLLMNDNWSGLIMDGSESNMNFVKNDSIYWKYDLQCKNVFITAENINELVASAGFDKEIGIFHIDIDGNDYWVWKAATEINPIVVIVEYNSLFGFKKPWTTPYQPDFVRTNYHYSNLLYGSSLLSLCDLAEEKGYCFVGCNSAGNNAYFVRKDKTGNLITKTAAEGYVASKFKEARKNDGTLAFLRGNERLKSLSGQKVYNTRTQQIELIE